MKFKLESSQAIDVNNFFRTCGYHLHNDPRSKQASFVRRLTSNLYPRFHLYIKSASKGSITCGLHLDQKKVKLGKQIIHAGDYDSEILKQEVQRIKANLAK